MIDKLLVQGFEARNAFLPEVALGFFEKASELDPADPYLQLEVARCFVELENPQEASDLLASVDAGDDDEARLDLAAAWKSLGRVDEALLELDQVKKGSSFFEQSVLEKVMLLERGHRIEEARRVLADSLGFQKSPQGIFAEALILEREGDAAAAESLLRRCWKGQPRSGFEIEVGYRLARLLEKGRQGGEALKILGVCKEQEAREMPLGSLREFTEARRKSDREWLEKLPFDWFSARRSVADSDGLLLLGHPRSGTSLLAKKLSQSLGVGWVDEKQIFTSQARKFTTGIEGVKDLIEYFGGLGESEISSFEENYREALGRFAGGAGRVIDKNPGLSCSLPSLHKLLPGSAWLMMLRDPRDVALSCYAQRFGHSALGAACLTLEGALEAVLHVTRYWLRVRDCLSADQYLEVRYEDFVKNPDEGLKDIGEQLGWRQPDQTEEKEAGGSLNLTPSYSAIERPVNLDATEKWWRYDLPWEELAPDLGGVLEELA